MELKGRTAVVTGSGTGVGRELAMEFARRGANVVCCGRRPEPIRETARMIEQQGGNVLAIPTDVTRQDQVEHLVAESLERFGSIDVLFNNAGSFNAIGGIWQVDPEVWWNDVTINVLGPMLCARAVLGHMMARNEGIIINMSGGGSSKPLAGGSGYGCSKAALLRLTDTLAAELERVDSSVLVFAMGPGFVRTEMTELQATTPEGLEWLPFSKEALDRGEDSSPQLCARATMELIRIACPELNGRAFNIATDYDEVARTAHEIRDKDLHQLRLQR